MDIWKWPVLTWNSSRFAYPVTRGSSYDKYVCVNKYNFMAGKK